MRFIAESAWTAVMRDEESVVAAMVPPSAMRSATVFLKSVASPPLARTARPMTGTPRKSPRYVVVRTAISPAAGCGLCCRMASRTAVVVGIQLERPLPRDDGGVGLAVERVERAEQRVDDRTVGEPVGRVAHVLERA